MYNTLILALWEYPCSNILGHNTLIIKPTSTYNIIQQPQKIYLEYAAIELISILMSSLDTDTESWCLMFVTSLELENVNIDPENIKILTKVSPFDTNLKSHNPVFKSFSNKYCVSCQSCVHLCR